MWISHIDEIIEGKGLKKGWVAKQIGVSAPYFSQWKHKPPNAEYLWKLAKVLNCSVDDLYTYIDE